VALARLFGHPAQVLLPLFSDHFESWELTSQGGDNAELGRSVRLSLQVIFAGLLDNPKISARPDGSHYFTGPIGYCNTAGEDLGDNWG